jgi:cytoskeletal protein CcmA (bactofilin family)
MGTKYGQYGSAVFHGDVRVDSDLDVDGTLNADAMDIDGALQLDSTLTTGVDGTGYDVKFFGDTSGSYLLWDASDDRLEFVYSRMSMGALSSESQTGVHMTATNNNVLAVYADDNNTTLTNAVYKTVHSRTMLFKDCTGISLFGVQGQIKCADEIDFASGVYAGVQGYFETIDDTDIQSGAKFWGVDASLESPSGGTVTVDSGGILGGLHAELTGAGQFTQSSGGILAGLYIDEQVTTGQWGYGIYIAAGAAAIGAYIGGTISATDGRALKISTTQATPAMTDGYGVIEKELNVSGTATGHITGESSWINLGTDAVVPSYCDVHNDGIYDATATLTSAYISWAKFQCLLASNPAHLSLWELNHSGAHSEIDSIFNVNDATLALGYQEGTPTKAAVGSIPIFSIAGGSPYYIYVYDAADSD